MCSISYEYLSQKADVKVLIYQIVSPDFSNRGHLKMVQLLVQNDSAVSKEDNYRNTPL